MRPIKFRGKRLYDDKWVYGYLWKDDACGDVFIKDGRTLIVHRVDPETIGQYICLDAEGNEVYEGDIVCRKRDLYYQTGKFAKSVIERYRVIYSSITFTFLVQPLIKGEGMEMNACYIKELGMVKEDQK